MEKINQIVYPEIRNQIRGSASQSRDNEQQFTLDRTCVVDIVVLRSSTFPEKYCTHCRRDWFNGGGGAFGITQTRQYSGMPDSRLNKAPPAPVTLFTTLCNNFSNLHKVSHEKKFSNPNFVNKENPNLHRCQQPSANTITEKCCNFLANAQKFRRVDCTESTSTDVDKEAVVAADEAKENCKRRKTSQNCTTTKRNAKQSSPRKQKKGKTKNTINYKYDMDDDPSDAYDSDTCSPPVISLASSPLHVGNPATNFNGEAVSCFDFFAAAKNSEILKPAAVVVAIKPKISGCRTRIPSDCGSDDSFIVFQCSPDDESDFTEEEMETEYEEDDDSDDSSCSESNLVFETDDTTSHKRVRFADDLCEVHPMYHWSYAYQAARKGPWELFARDRCRFRVRIESSDAVIGPVLQPDHRQKIFEARFAEMEN